MTTAQLEPVTSVLWDILDSPKDLRRIPCVWREVMGESHAWLSRYLQPTGEQAVVYPCPEGGPECPRRVIRHGPGDLVAVCSQSPKVCGRVEVSAVDLMLYELSLERLARPLCKALGIHAGFETVATSRRLCVLGAVTVTPGDRQPVYLALPSSRSALANLLLRILAFQVDPFVLLTPTYRHVTRGALEPMERAGGRHLVLADLLTVAQGRFECCFDLRECLLERPPQVEAVVKSNIFQRQGDYWRIVFQGEQVLMSHSKGLGYLLVLLREPGREFSPHDLRLANGEETGLTEFLNDSVNEQALEKARNRLIELEAEIELAEAEHDLGTLERRKDEKATILQQLQEQLAPRREDPHKRVRDQVSKAIKRSLETLGRQHPSLGRHLESRMHFGGSFVYRPTDDPEWQL